MKCKSKKFDSLISKKFNSIFNKNTLCNFQELLNTDNKKKMDYSYLCIVLAIVAFLLIFLIVILIKQNKQDDTHLNISRRSYTKRKGMATGIAAGLGIGIAIGKAMENIALGIAIGVAIGSSLGVSFESTFRKKEEQQQIKRNSRYSQIQSKSTNNAVILGLIMVILSVLAFGIAIFFKT